jgi:bifunctional protein TilS/HprT
MEDASEQGAIVNFAHESERNFARFLDFYHIEWRYEATCFPLERDEQGRVTLSFTPDFYLPQFDLYIELTTMKQSLVTRKNRKLRLMRALYPEVKIKMLYNRDFRRLLFKFGQLSA